LENSNFHEEYKPAGYMVFHLFTTDACLGLNDHHPEITLKILEAFSVKIVTAEDLLASQEGLYSM
jgi:hypothetical protein